MPKETKDEMAHWRQRTDLSPRTKHDIERKIGGYLAGVIPQKREEGKQIAEKLFAVSGSPQVQLLLTLSAQEFADRISNEMPHVPSGNHGVDYGIATIESTIER